jgi:hypothetical protein
MDGWMDGWAGRTSRLMNVTYVYMAVDGHNLSLSLALRSSTRRVWQLHAISLPSHNTHHEREDWTQQASKESWNFGGNQ